MKNLMNLAILAIILLITVPMYGQSLIVKAGYNSAEMTTTSNRGYESVNGYHLGIYMDYIINPILTIETGLGVSQKGRQQSTSVAGLDLLSTKVNLNYLEIPVNLKAGSQVTPEIKLYGKAGPYVGIGMSGKTTRKTSVLGFETDVQNDINFGSGENDTKKLDFGINLGGGLEIKNIVFEVSYDMGLANTSNKIDETMNHNVMKFTAGYKF